MPRGVVERIVSLQSKAFKQPLAATDLYFGILKKGIGRLLAPSKTGSEPFTAPRTVLTEPIRAARRKPPAKRSRVPAKKSTSRRR